MKAILTDLKNLTNGSVGQIVQKFSGNTPGYNWEVKDSVLAGSQNAFTSQAYNKATGTVTTTFDASKFTNATNLSIARTILHESIHAHLIAFAKNDPLAVSKSYAQLIKDLATLNANDAQHAEFVRSFVGDIANSLEELGQKYGYQHPSTFYNELAWGGLTHTTDNQGNTIEAPWFTNSFPSPIDRKRILDTINAELTGKDSNGNAKPQVGKNAGC